MAIIQSTVAFVTAVTVPALAASAQAPRVRAEARRPAAAAYGQSRGAAETERFSRTFRVGATGVLDLSNLAGDVTVTGGGGDQISVVAEKRARERSGRTAKEQLALVSIETAERGGRVEVRTVYPRNERNLSVSVAYTVTVPAGISALVKSMAGDVTVRNVQGEIRAETMSGNVTAADTGRQVFLKTVSGDVEVQNTPAEAVLTLQTVSGTVVARNVRCKSLEGNSVSGDIQLTDTTSARVSVGSMSGDVEYAGTLARGGRYEMRSHSGDIRLALAAEVGFELDATTFSGSVRSDLPVTLRSLGDEERRGARRSLRGTYGDASAVLELTTFTGGIVIAKR